MSVKTIPFKTPAVRTAEDWVQPSQPAAAPKPEPVPTKRLTVDIPETLHRRIKLDGVQRGLLISDIVRQLLDTAYPAPADSAV